MRRLYSRISLGQIGPLIVSISVLMLPPVQGATLTFDFDNGTPPLQPTMGLPLSQTVSGVTAAFTGRFSIQSHDTTFYNLPNFSGNYLYPNDVFSPSLTISFSQALTAIAFDFATADFGLDRNTTLKLTAYQDLVSNPPVGSTTSTAVGEGWGLGSLAFLSPSAFNLVNIVILPGAGSDFLADNFTVTSIDGGNSTVPEPASVIFVGAGILTLAALARLRRIGMR